MRKQNKISKISLENWELNPKNYNDKIEQNQITPVPGNTWLTVASKQNASSQHPLSISLITTAASEVNTSLQQLVERSIDKNAAGKFGDKNDAQLFAK